GAEPLHAGDEPGLEDLGRLGPLDLAVARVLGDEVDLLALAGPLEDLADRLLGLALLVAFRRIDVADARGEHELDKAGLDVPARPHAEPGDDLSGLAERDRGER